MASNVHRDKDANISNRSFLWVPMASQYLKMIVTSTQLELIFQGHYQTTRIGSRKDMSLDRTIKVSVVHVGLSPLPQH